MSGKARAARVTGEERAELARSLETQYRAGASIRELSAARALLRVHPRTLTDAGVRSVDAEKPPGLGPRAGLLVD